VAVVVGVDAVAVAVAVLRRTDGRCRAFQIWRLVRKMGANNACIEALCGAMQAV
jgi:hypothetical protein